MPHKNNQNTLSKYLDKKISLEEIPSKTLKVTFHALRWVFLLIFMFVVIGIFVLFLTGGGNYIKLIVGYSIAGFFTFFMGYFGWILAQSVIETLMGKEREEENSISYYIRKSKNKDYRY
ncbi:MAG: hypothetical protein V5A64_04190 [Candidatus Thermoplasmatota archaeon]